MYMYREREDEEGGMGMEEKKAAAKVRKMK